MVGCWLLVGVFALASVCFGWLLVYGNRWWLVLGCSSVLGGSCWLIVGLCNSPWSLILGCC